MLKTKTKYRSEIIFFVLTGLICFLVLSFCSKKILAAENGQVNLEAWDLTDTKKSDGTATSSATEVVEATLSYNSSVESGFKDIVIPNAADFKSTYPNLEKVWIDRDTMKAVANNANKENGSLKISDTGSADAIPADAKKVFACGDDWSFTFEDGLILSINLSNFDTSSITDMSGMFAMCNNLAELDLSSFDTSQVTDMSVMFDGCNNLMELDLSSFNTSLVTDMSEMFDGCNNLMELDLSRFNTSLVTDMSEMFYGCNNLMELDLSSFDTSQVTDMSGMFYRCNNLMELDLSSFDTSQVTNMIEMFYECNNLMELDLSRFGTSQVTNMIGMFYGCNNLMELDLSSFDTSQVTNMSEMFYGCNNLMELDLSSFDTSQVTGMIGMFAFCESLKQLDLSNFNTSGLTDMYAMFAFCKSLTELDLSSFDTSQVTDMYAMFALCKNLMELDLSSFDTSQVTDMSHMFEGCGILTKLELSNFNTSNVTNMAYMFAFCNNLTELDVSNFDTSKVTNMTYMFNGCKSVKQLDISNFNTEERGYSWGTINNSGGSSGSGNSGGGNFSRSQDKNLISKNESTNTKTSIQTESKVPEKLQTRKYLVGNNNGTIKPNDSVTNAELVTVIYRLMNNGEKINYDNLKNVGVEKSDWFANAVAYLTDDARKIIKVADKKFNPNKNITGYEMLNIIHNVLKFYDADKNFAVDQDLNSNITRAKMAEIIFKAFDRKSNPGEKFYSDLNDQHWAYKYLMDASE